MPTKFRFVDSNILSLINLPLKLTAQFKKNPEDSFRLCYKDSAIIFKPFVILSQYPNSFAQISIGNKGRCSLHHSFSASVYSKPFNKYKTANINIVIMEII